MIQIPSLDNQGCTVIIKFQLASELCYIKHLAAFVVSFVDQPHAYGLNFIDPKNLCNASAMPFLDFTCHFKFVLYDPSPNILVM